VRRKRPAKRNLEASSSEKLKIATCFGGFFVKESILKKDRREKAKQNSARKTSHKKKDRKTKDIPT